MLPPRSTPRNSWTSILAALTRPDLASQQQILYDTARALAESPTLEEASPRMIEAVCHALGWQCGAIWEADRARKIMRCAGTWHAPGLRVR